ncbi:MAG TPA: hypothetical protein VGR84_11140 [Candidatus Acidoferrales bacterium]|nr:hypothetical protein [Candidatus Acidoferrales bacterium]
MQAAVFYPAGVKTRSTTMGPYVIDAASGAVMSPGAFPLIALSHGSGGNCWDLHDFATYLASRGFVVACVNHPGDNFQDHSGLGTDRVLIGRALQMSALIDAMLRDPTLGPHINPSHIGAAGFSAGGYTALLLAGARPNFDLLNDYCCAYPKDPEFCTGWRVRITRPDLTLKSDPRVKAIFIMSPVGIYFDRAALAGVHVRVRLWAAAADAVLPLKANAERIRSLLPRPPEYSVIPNAGHFIFLAPCTQSMRVRLSAICTDPPGVDRAKIHSLVNADAARFFSSAFGAPEAVREGKKGGRTNGIPRPILGERNDTASSMSDFRKDRGASNGR